MNLAHRNAFFCCLCLQILDTEKICKASQEGGSTSGAILPIIGRGRLGVLLLQKCLKTHPFPKGLKAGRTTWSRKKGSAVTFPAKGDPKGEKRGGVGGRRER